MGFFCQSYINLASIKPCTKITSLLVIFSYFSQSVDDKESIKRKEVIGNRIDGAIVESIPGSALSAEDADPQTR